MRRRYDGAPARVDIGYSRARSDVDALPFLTDDIPGIGGRFRASPDDFRVEEIPAYAPCGEGDHLFVTFEKRGVNTVDAVRSIAKALGVSEREAGWAGLKDRHAVTVQTASFLFGDAPRALALELPGIRVLSAVRHKNKLRTGHLHGNRFSLLVRDCVPEAAERAERVCAVLSRRGVPNFFGAQRFGRDGANADRARAWLLGQEPPPRDRTLRKLYVSSLQSELFNQYLSQRMADGLFDRYVPGDLAMRYPVGGPFPIEPAEAETTYANGTCSPTGPMFGHGMRAPTEVAAERERAVLEAGGVPLEGFRRAGDLGEGTRRALRMVVDALQVSIEHSVDCCNVRLSFGLPAGGYATIVLREFRKTDDEGLQSNAGLGIEAPAQT